MSSRGDVVLVLFPNSDLRGAKPRPALVVQADHLDTDLPQVIVAMITSRTFRANHPSRVLVELSGPEGRSSGLLADSVVMTDNLATIQMAAIGRTIGSLPMQRVDQALRHTLGLGQTPMPHTKKSRIYWRSQGGTLRAYADFRDVGGGREALMLAGETRHHGVRGGGNAGCRAGSSSSGRRRATPRCLACGGGSRSRRTPRSTWSRR